jgi:ribosomal-protein-alanine N-acetyltransferase
MTLELDPWDPPRIETDRLLLRPFTEDDLESVFVYASNPAVTRYTLWEAHRSPADTLRFVREYAQSRYAERVPEPLALCLRERPGWVVGSIGCFWANQANRCMEMGYALGEPHWGRGYAVEAARALTDYAFERYPIERLQAHCIAANRASARVMAKLGMTFEGQLRSALLHRGEFKDILLYSLLRSEWEASTAPPSEPGA